MVRFRSSTFGFKHDAHSDLLHGSCVSHDIIWYWWGWVYIRSTLKPCSPTKVTLSEGPKCKYPMTREWERAGPAHAYIGLAASVCISNVSVSCFCACLQLQWCSVYQVSCALYIRLIKLNVFLKRIVNSTNPKLSRTYATHVRSHMPTYVIWQFDSVCLCIMKTNQASMLCASCSIW